ncbi:hypothetical protein C6575_14460 [Nocardia seriolae]|nr:hypothetical protein C6575_14460 [Nocardia seriolae]
MTTRCSSTHPMAVRLVASTASSGTCSSRSAMAWPTPSSTCSQLSSTSTQRDASGLPSASSRARRAVRSEKSPSITAAAISSSTASALAPADSFARCAQYTGSPVSRRSRAVAVMASLVFPIPPEPTSVTMRAPPGSRIATRSSSGSRPTNPSVLIGIPTPHSSGPPTRRTSLVVRTDASTPTSVDSVTPGPPVPFRPGYRCARPTYSPRLVNVAVYRTRMLVHRGGRIRMLLPGDTRSPSAIHGTTPARTAGLLRATALRLGVPPGELNALEPSVDPDVLDDDRLRVPTEWVWRVWELIAAAAGPGSGLLVAAAAEHSGLHVWDYLFTCAPTLAESVRTAIDLRGVVTDPGTDWAVEERGSLLTFRATPTAEPTAALAAIEEFTLSTVLRRLRAAARQQLIPVRVAFSHNATHFYNRMSDEFDTSRIDFASPCAEITFLDAGPLPTGSDPYLGAMLRDHAHLLLTASRSAPDWRETLHDTITDALRTGDPSLDAAARRLTMSPRTLQRRLQAMGTNWRQEVESVRHQHALHLIRHSDLPVQSVAARLGYTDARTLRRALRRWTGHTATDFRRTLPVTADPC